MEAALQAER